MYKILCIGNQWRGADDGALFRAFTRLGHSVYIADNMFFVPPYLTSFPAKAAAKIIRPILVREYNRYLVKQFNLFQPDLVLVFKGNYVFPESINYFKKSDVPVINVYPDISVFAYGNLIPACIPLYDYIFTTKSFGINDLYKEFKITNIEYMPHGFDPEIHRPLSLEEENRYNHFSAEVTFIGSHSAKKENILHDIAHRLPKIDLKIWGASWHHSRSVLLKNKIQGMPIHGDMYSICLQKSKISLGILTEQLTGASSGDQITARTFQIPATGAFMLHERTEELLQYFEDGREIATYGDADELCEKAAYYLAREDERRRIAEAGRKKAWSAHSVDHRAAFILDRLVSLKLLESQRSFL